MKNKLAVAEYFYSLQGEGRTMGIPAIFVRLAGCNLMCGGQGTEKDGKLHDGATWRCDTIEVWLEGKTQSFENLTDTLIETLDFVQRLQAGVHLVITGGEPLLQQDRLLHWLEWLEQQYKLRPTIEVETNATIIPLPDLDARVSYWNTSPKLQNSGMPEASRVFEPVLHWFAQNPKTMSKFVIGSESDWCEINRDFIQTGLIDRKQIVLMAAADSRESLMRTNKQVADICIRESVRMCTRLHVEIWDRLTGV
jgi:7-carboxy-7-deazaguanine synthase